MAHGLSVFAHPKTDRGEPWQTEAMEAGRESARPVVNRKRRKSAVSHFRHHGFRLWHNWGKLGRTVAMQNGCPSAPVTPPKGGVNWRRTGALRRAARNRGTALDPQTGAVW